jgi:peptide/nickel transport system permease protein
MQGLIFEGDFGFSFLYNKPVSALIWERLGLTIVLSLSSTVFIWVVAFPIGLYSAVRQYSPGDYIATFFGFLGRATPNFLLALVLMYISVMWFGESVGGLFSPEYEDAPWSFGKAMDLLSNLLVPTIVIGTAGTAGLIRIFRANLLDELNKQYVTTARAKGKQEWKLVLKYPVRVAINPFISTMGWMLPELISGATITSIVLNLPTTGPLLFNALRSQDMYLAGSFLMLLAFLTVIGTVISDLLLAWVDPRIRYE